MNNHYEYKCFRQTERGEQDFYGQFCLPNIEACRQDFWRRFPNRVDLCCVIRNSCGYVIVAIKDYSKKKFRHIPDRGWHVIA